MAAVTQADVDALEQAIASGVKKARYQDQEVEFQSTADMQRALATMRAQLAAAAGTSSVTRANTRKF